MTREAYDQVMYAPHRAKLSHELIAAAAAYEAMKLWNEHQQRNGNNVNHAHAKEFMAAAAGFFIDRIIETKGLDAAHGHRAKGHYHQHHHHHHHRF